MNVTVIIPVRNAALTLPETIESLQAQTFSGWEAIIVENGSTDETHPVAEDLASRDSRIRVLRLPDGGVGAARNAGIRAARHEWLLFLDGDDRILPSYLEAMTRVLLGDPALDGAYCGAIRVTEEGGSAGPDLYPGRGDLFEGLTKTCTWCIHCVVVRRARVLEVGGFPEDLLTCEDWLLWQRLIRSGARFARVPLFLAIYKVRSSSASMDGLRMARDMIRVVTLGHGPDPAVPNPLPEYANGVPAERAPVARLASLAWAAALLIGQGEDGSRVLDLVPDDRDPDLDPEVLASSLFLAARFPRSLPESAWPRLWPEVEGRVRDLFDAYERHSGAPRLAHRAMRAMERLLLEGLDQENAITLGTTHHLRLEMTEPFPDLVLPSQVERLSCTLYYQGDAHGSLLLPVCDGFVSAAVLADAIAEEHALSILDRYWEHVSERGLRWGPLFFSSVGRRLIHATGSRLGRRRKDFEQWALASLSDFTLLREIFPKKWKGGRVRPAVDRPPRVELCAAIPDLVFDGEELDVIVEFTGLAVGTVRVPARNGIASAAAIRRAAIDACGAELCRLTVREALLERTLLDSTPLRGRLAERWKARQGSGAAEGGASGNDASTLPYGASGRGALFLARRAAHRIGAAASRRASLPAGAAPDLLETAEALGEPVAGTRAAGETPRRVLYAPEIFNVSTCGPDGPEPPPAPRGARIAETAIRFIQRAVPASRRTFGARAIADHLPILMYHRVAEDGPPALARYRVSPALFEEQIRFLESRGFYAIDLDTWRWAKERRRQLRGRPVLLTFDDGYRDFAENAWPVLRRHGFGATVFLVADRLGGTAAWDERLGETAPLLSPDEIRALQGEGVSFGSHTMTHAPLTALSPEEIVIEASRSRRALEKMLGRPVRAMAYPYGDYDPVVRHLVGASGYDYGLTAREDISRYSDHLLALPRIEIHPGCAGEGFARLLDPAAWKSPR